jgi:HTH-type transcriptional regulator / antitoxin HipB
MEVIARTPQQLGHALMRVRRKQELTQDKLAELSGLRQGTVSTAEGGEPGTEIGTICTLLAALDLEIVIRPRASLAVPIGDGAAS